MHSLPPGLAWRTMLPAFLPGAVWTGREMIVSAGAGPKGEVFDDGAQSDPALNRWTPMRSRGAAARTVPGVVRTATEMIIFGGLGPGNTPITEGGRYDPLIETWRPIATADAPSAR